MALNNRTRVMVIGGAGYIGSRLVPALLDDGHEVTVVDLLWFGNHLPSGVPLVQKDALALTSAEYAGYDAVIFMGGLSNDPMAEFSPMLNFISNASTPAHAAYTAKQAGVPRFIYASSCSVYGFADDEDCTEKDIPQAAFPYGISKLQGEVGSMQLASDGFSVISLRQGTVSGWSPRMRFDLFINTMYMAAAMHKRITVRNSSIWRPLLAIEDAIEAYRRALAAPQRVSGIYNVSSCNIAVAAAADRIRAHMHARHAQTVTVIHEEKHDPRNYRASMEKARRELGFMPTGTVESILQGLDEHFGLETDFNNDTYHNVRVLNSIGYLLPASVIV